MVNKKSKSFLKQAHCRPVEDTSYREANRHFLYVAQRKRALRCPPRSGTLLVHSSLIAATYLTHAGTAYALQRIVIALNLRLTLAGASNSPVIFPIIKNPHATLQHVGLLRDDKKTGLT